MDILPVLNQVRNVLLQKVYVAKFGMISGHPGGQVLEMANGIPNEKMVLTMG